ncbi:hypothetical protein EST38_g13954 [Candolleomyces aberdarensis]|uniref:Uncharacterized protein n=1 Tax=Candolleomyces aberdarensis TaxID=2316362 RepID=A0A4Q2CYJ4_9AGAR|nr:hypothetical protein EST38_g13954 [Candolleomyces aberdarensis]
MDLESRQLISALVQDNHFAKRAMLNSKSLNLFNGGKKAWVGDIVTAFGRPKYPVHFNIERIESVEGIELELPISEVEQSGARRFHDELPSTGRSPLLGPAARGPHPGELQSVCRLRKYLQTVVIPAHRRARTRLCVDHPLQ